MFRNLVKRSEGPSDRDKIVDTIQRLACGEIFSGSLKTSGGMLLHDCNHMIVLDLSEIIHSKWTFSG
jgi:hypothetical protein